MITKFDTKKSIRRAKTVRKKRTGWVIKVPNGEYTWSNKIERVSIIRRRLPYESIEVSKRGLVGLLKSLMENTPGLIK